MPVLFRPDFVGPILDGKKTETRRIWSNRPRVREGGVYQARESPTAPPFARLKVTSLRREKLQAITIGGVRREGFKKKAEFRKAWEELYGPESWERNPPVWVVRFEVVQQEEACGGESASSPSSE